ncbi:MAG: VTT domain-containing protein [Bdellovibrio sp.]
MNFVNIILHLDQYIPLWIIFFGPWLYVILFLVIFAETGVVVTPFLPGDSLLFAVGAFTAMGNGLNLWVLLTVLTLAGILGDTANYHIGKYLGPKVFEAKSRFFKKEHLQKTHSFYERWGAFTIVAARFAPIVRTFAPFVAGIGSMQYRKFLFYNTIGAIAWVFTFVLAGHFFGNLPAVKGNFHIMIFGIIGISMIPMLWPWATAIISKLKKNQSTIN